jgi:hypothetical protein
MSRYDEEKNLAVESVSYGTDSPHEDLGEAIIAGRPKPLQKLNEFLSRVGGEERGIERVLPHEKTDQVTELIYWLKLSSIRMIISQYG